MKIPWVFFFVQFRFFLESSKPPTSDQIKLNDGVVRNKLLKLSCFVEMQQ